MKKTYFLLAYMAILTSASPAWAAAAATATPQQNRMKACAAQYHQKKIAKSGYHAFMSQCLKTHASAPAAGKAPAAP